MEENIQIKIESFFKAYRELKFKRGQLLLEPEAEPKGLYFLKEGLVKQYSISENGDEVTINTFKSPSLFPMNWILNDSENYYYYEASIQSTLLLAPKTESLEFLKNNSDVLLDLVKRIYRGLDGYFMKMEQLMSGSARTRLITALLIYAKRFGTEKDGSFVLKIKVTESNLASETGLSRETVSREIQKLKNKNLIDFNKNPLTVKNLRNLEQELFGK